MVVTCKWKKRKKGGGFQFEYLGMKQKMENRVQGRAFYKQVHNISLPMWSFLQVQDQDHHVQLGHVTFLLVHSLEISSVLSLPICYSGPLNISLFGLFLSTRFQLSCLVDGSPHSYLIVHVHAINCTFCAFNYFILSLWYYGCNFQLLHIFSNTPHTLLSIVFFNDFFILR